MRAASDRVLRPYEVAGRAVRGINRATAILLSLSELEGEADFVSVDIHGVKVAVDNLAVACKRYEERWQQVHAG